MIVPFSEPVGRASEADVSGVCSLDSTEAPKNDLDLTDQSSPTEAFAFSTNADSV